jgi:hypothetical protein
MDSRTEDNRRFVKHLNASQQAVWEIAQWLSSLGKVVTIPPTYITPSYEERMNFVDEGDIYMSDIRGGEQKRVEVKHLGTQFTGADDWKFGDNFMVCARHSFDNADPKPYLYIYLSKDKTHIATLKGDTHKEWFVKTFTDKRYENMTQEFYICKTSLLKFMRNE